MFDNIIQLEYLVVSGGLWDFHIDSGGLLFFAGFTLILAVADLLLSFMTVAKNTMLASWQFEFDYQNDSLTINIHDGNDIDLLHCKYFLRVDPCSFWSTIPVVMLSSQEIR